MRESNGEIDRVYVERETRDPSFVMPTYHHHPYLELYYMNSGLSRFFIGNRLYDLHPGDLMLIPPGELHYTRYLQGACTRTAVFFRREDVRGEMEKWLEGVHILHFSSAHREGAEYILEQMLLDERMKDPLTRVSLQVHLQSLLIHCMRFAARVELPDRIHTTDSQILAAAEYICANYDKPVTTAQIAAYTGFSANYLSGRFREATGVGLHEYLVFVRLRQGAGELISTDRSITRIALSCGFTSPNYFKDAFKKMYGLTPREYRKRFL